MSSPSTPPEPAPGSLAGLSLAIFQDLLTNLTHDLVLQSHRAEKLLRTQQQARAAATATATSGSIQTEDYAVPKFPPGNPLATVPDEILCPRCNLPRHTVETMNMGPVNDEMGQRKKFCTKLPWQKQRGHDIYGNPFPNPNSGGQSKKAKVLATVNGDSPTGGESDVMPVKQAKNAGIVYFKCTSCDQEKVASSRYAAHLEKCLGLSGRKSSRAAMQKMNNNLGSGNRSPMLGPVDSMKTSGSRKQSPEKNGRGTPAPPGEDASSASMSRSFSNAVQLNSSTAPINPTATPKKKKKLAAAATGSPIPASNTTAVDNNLSQTKPSSSSTPVVPILPAASTSSTPIAPAPPKDPSSAPLPKKQKRKRNIDNPDTPSEGGEAPPARPKKPKLASSLSAESFTNTSNPPIAPAPPPGGGPDPAQQVTPKKSTLVKLKAKAPLPGGSSTAGSGMSGVGASPTPSETSNASPTLQKKKAARPKQPPPTNSDGSPIKKIKKPGIGRPPKSTSAGTGAQPPPLAPAKVVGGSGGTGGDGGVVRKGVTAQAGGQ